MLLFVVKSFSLLGHMMVLDVLGSRLYSIHVSNLGDFDV